MATPEIRRRPGGRSAQVRSAVVAATLELLADNGPTGVTISEVAKRAGVHETSIYRRWGNRDRLVLDAMVERSAELIQVPDSGSLRADLIALGQGLVEYGRTPLGEALMRTMAACTDDDGTASARAEFWLARYEESRVVVERAKQRGELDDSVDARLLLEMFIAPIHFRLLLTREGVDQEFLERNAEVVVDGFCARPAGLEPAT
jgi:AcrR family transcriptional regulator